MKTVLVESDRNKQRVYNSLLVEPNKLSIFGSRLAIKIVNELTKTPSCAMDLARRLKQHEQNIYYHLNKLEKAGIIRITSREQRYGMTAKIYSVVSPVIATKLCEDGKDIDAKTHVTNPELEEFLFPFVNTGKLNAMVVIGDTYSHGRFDKSSTEGPHAFDIGIMLGRFISRTMFPNYKLDTEMVEKDLKNNLILIGNPQTNIIIDRINKQLPLYFDEKNEFCIVSKITNKLYEDPRIGIILKITSPFSKERKILVLGGRGRRGTRSAVLACTKYFHKISNGIEENGDIKRVVKGYDKNGDKIIDDIEVLE